MVKAQNNLWSIVRHPYVDADVLADAIVDQVHHGDLDYCSRLLVRDSLHALGQQWGEHRLTQWLIHSPVQQQLNSILKETFDRIGFPTLEGRVMEFTIRQDIEAMFRAIGSHLRSPLKIAIGGSTALILPGLLARQTEDVDVVDEVPKILREDHAFMESLRERFGLKVAHFQSHYLPMRWENRTHWHGEYDELTVVLVDPIDVFLSKLFSIRSKDYTDMKILIQQLDRTVILDRLKRDCQSMLASESLKDHATKNWYILTGDRLEL
ncbi:MAG TPA: DUF6036 family nucleotidyltransferase [Gemmatales bacterium]|nr:DUF6036 family nucleotidyltransferase [Gemmatales bacterium]